uniref:Altered inheritance of mitochondria protein 24, mitochondrial n=1 Tax=Amphora coffeiformis TaxID=265554 RepID=A0A7S3P8V1_9STRA|eukprot:scaffold25445_cov183-Amphora_coffeaeformis.AAC.7
MNHRNASPVWSIQNSGSFASVLVDLPPNTEVCCETDAVVSFSQGVTVQGQIAGGLFGALARTFLTNESFFTTKVRNALTQQNADVLIAPVEPGGIVLHRLVDDDPSGLYVTSGAYVASDATVKIASRVQRNLTNSVFSGSGMFLLHATGLGTVACAAYGAVHAYRLERGETRAVDNGHLVAWTSGMHYTTGLASRGAGTFGNIMGSLTSGEGLMCYFQGPGILYIQSHKPQSEKEGQSKTTRGVNPIQLFFLVVFLGVFVGFGLLMLFMASTSETTRQHGNRYQRYAEF